MAERKDGAVTVTLEFEVQGQTLSELADRAIFIASSFYGEADYEIDSLTASPITYSSGHGVLGWTASVEAEAIFGGDDE